MDAIVNLVGLLFSSVMKPALAENTASSISLRREPRSNTPNAPPSSAVCLFSEKRRAISAKSSP
jgi:hypothetical protein